MWSELLPSIFPASASTFADQVDHLYAFLLALTAFFTVGISAVALYLGIRYRRRSPDEVGHQIHGSMALEISWSIIPLPPLTSDPSTSRFVSVRSTTSTCASAAPAGNSPCRTTGSSSMSIPAAFCSGSG